MKRERIRIAGMGCEHCVHAVEAALDEIGVAVESVKIGEADIRYDDAAMEPTSIDAAVASAGYSVVAHDELGETAA